MHFSGYTLTSIRWLVGNRVMDKTSKGIYSSGLRR